MAKGATTKRTYAKRCTECGASGVGDVIKHGVYISRKGHFQQWKCKRCGHCFKGGKIKEGRR